MCLSRHVRAYVGAHAYAFAGVGSRACERARIYAGMIIVLGAYIIIYSGAVCEYACACVCIGVCTYVHANVHAYVCTGSCAYASARV